MEAKKNILTSDGLRQLEDELSRLKQYLKVDIAQKIKEAREQGDLSENAEYDAAKDEQRDVNMRIEEIEAILKNVEVVGDDDVDYNSVNVGCSVTILDMEYNEEETYHIVGSTQADILQKKISDESPIGAALMKHVVGDVVTVETQVGELQFKIIEIKKFEK